MFSFLSGHYSDGSDDDESQTSHSALKHEVVNVLPTSPPVDETYKLNDLKSQNAKLTTQLLSLQELVSSKSTLCQQYKQKYERAEEEKVKAMQDSADMFISLQNENAKLESENANMKRQLMQYSGGKGNGDTTSDQMIKDLHDKVKVFEKRCMNAEESSRLANEKIEILESELKRKVLSSPSDGDGHIKSVRPMQLPEKYVNECEKILIECVQRDEDDNNPVSNMLLETKLLEMKAMQWSSAVHLRESAILFKHSESIQRVLEQFTSQSHMAANGGNKHQQPPLLFENVMRKSLDVLESSFEKSRRYAVVLDARLEAARHATRVELLNVLESEVERVDSVFSDLDQVSLNCVNDLCAAINKSVRYRPSESSLRQECYDEGGGGDFSGSKVSVEYMHNIRRECPSLLPVFDSFLATARLKCPDTVVTLTPSLKKLDEIMYDTFMLHGGDYSLICDYVSSTVQVSDLNALRELLETIGSSDNDRKRSLLPGRGGGEE